MIYQYIISDSPVRNLERCSDIIAFRTGQIPKNGIIFNMGSKANSWHIGHHKVRDVPTWKQSSGCLASFPIAEQGWQVFATVAVESSRAWSSDLLNQFTSSDVCSALLSGRSNSEPAYGI
jgi:hypothetical protein